MDEVVPMESCAFPAMEEALHAYVDGELSVTQQAALFAHLSECSSCRAMLDSVLAFRRYSREEHLVVPPALDALLMQRLATVKDRPSMMDRASDRDPLWSLSRPVTLRAGMVVALLVFLLGVLLPQQPPANEVAPQPTYETDVLVRGMNQPLDLLAPKSGPEDPTTLYVFYPGLTIEAIKPGTGPS